MNDIDIRSFWKGQPIPAIDLSAMRRKIRHFRLRRIVEAYLVIALMALALVFGMAIWIFWTPELAVTKVGIALTVVGFILPVLSYGRSLRLYHGLKADCSNIDYMNRLLEIKRQEHRQLHIVLDLYFMFLSSGFSLYIYEYTFCRSSCLGIVAYSLLFLWISINWFVFRPYMIRKRNSKFSDLIKNIEDCMEQLLK